MKFELNWPSMFYRRTDAGVTGKILAHPWVFGSGELKRINPGSQDECLYSRFFRLCWSR